MPEPRIEISEVTGLEVLAKFTAGTLDSSAWVLAMPPMAWICSAPSAVPAAGISRRLSSRLRAVTSTSSSSGAAAAVVWA